VNENTEQAQQQQEEEEEEIRPERAQLAVPVGVSDEVSGAASRQRPMPAR
tara:strand:- start:981 stop:1130 length:150 start_codon:yes stop_codon:yes gene_type:complete